MIAKFTKTECSNARNMGQEKETIQTLNLIGIKKGEFKELATVRFYMGRSASASVVYCSLWVNGKDKKGHEIYVSGRGNAGGYGYHKSSAAMQEALDSAGIELYGNAYVPGREKEKRYGLQTKKVDFKKRAHINGVGDTAIEDAIMAIGEALGYTRKSLKILRN